MQRFNEIEIYCERNVEKIRAGNEEHHKKWKEHVDWETIL